METLKEKYKNEIKQKINNIFKYSNTSNIPKIEKVIIHRGLGEAVTNSKVVEITRNQFLSITGQLPILTKAKKSISNFKLREGQIIGCKVTLRDNKMYDFLTKLINIILPKIRDFRGLSRKSFDGMGNYTFGLKEDNIFPEIDYDVLDKPRGLDITIVTTAKTNKESEKMLELFGMPFTRINEDQIKRDGE